jgi:hypothetical protein
MSNKRPQNNYQRVACLAYYLAHERNTPHFKTRDITNLNTEAAQSTLSNSAVFVRDATSKYHFLSAAGGGKKQITALGEAVVEALPDQAKVSAAIADHNPRRKARRRRKRSA